MYGYMHVYTYVYVNVYLYVYTILPKSSVLLNSKHKEERER